MSLEELPNSLTPAQVAQFRHSIQKELSKRDRVEFARACGIEPDEWQANFLRSESDRVLLNCCRQSGKSTTTALVALHTALYEPGSLTLVLGPAERQAKEFFSKVMEFYRALGLGKKAISERKLGMEMDNGSRIEALPGVERTIRGFSRVRRLILDEASRVPDGLYYAVRPMLAVSGGSLYMLSSPFGKRGVFYEEWVGNGDWERYEVTAHECPRITHEFIEEERAALPRLMFDQEYMCKFTETDDALFSHEEIEAAMSANVTPLFGYGA